MKKLLKLLAVGAMSVSLFGGVAGAQAANNCSISNTGPGSNNTCTVTNTTTVTVTCTNGVNVVNGTIQNSTTGTATVNNNTNSISATSGNANNNNALATELASYCVQPAVATPAPTTPTPTPTGGSGAATPAPVVVKALPKTGKVTATQTVAMLAASLLAVAAGVQLAVSAYRRRVLN